MVPRPAPHPFPPRGPVRSRGPNCGRARTLPGLGTNPPNGATVYCFWEQKPEEEATLGFLDARDSVVRRLASRPKEPADSLKVEAGLNRFVWDLRSADAHRFKGLVFWAGNTRGPLAVPGSYKVRLTVGAWSETRGLSVVKDPRGKATQAELQQQFDLLVRVRDRVRAADDAVQPIRDVKEQIDAAAKRAKGLPAGKGAAIARAADSLQAKLGAAEEAIYQVRNKSNEARLNLPIKVNN